jgi:uncharacterized cupin superfamily protein
VAEATVKSIEELESSMGGGFKHVGKSLGIGAFGVNILDIPAGYDGYPEHDHSEDGQEELYIPVAGSATIEIDGEAHALEPGVVAHVPSGVKRKLVTTDSSVRIVAVGGTPGQAYGS